MASLIKGKSFSQLSRNGQIINQQGFDATYDGNKAVVDTMDNDKFLRVELDNNEVVHLIKKILKNNKNTSTSLKDSLMSDFNVNKSSLVKDLYKNSKHSKSLISSLFSNDDLNIIDEMNNKTRHKRKDKRKKRKTIRKKKRKGKK